MVHNRYCIPGGEDEVHRRERDALVSAGHEVAEYVRFNDEIASYKLPQWAALGARTVWAWDSKAAIRKALDGVKPDVVHFHNTFPLVSPAAYYACREAGVPVVQSLDNPRLLCPNATLWRAGRVCEECCARGLWRSMAHRCYRNSCAATAAVALMLATHRRLGTWNNLVDCYIVATTFYRKKFIGAGLPERKIAVKPHFVEDHGTRRGDGAYALFVGRLAPEKGIDTLVRAWRNLPHVPLKVRGEGPLSAEVRQLAQESKRSVALLPRLASNELAGLIQGARFLVWPSEGYYETFGFVAAEAFACGVPVIASDVGVAQEIVGEGRTGLHFAAADPQDLAAKVEWAWAHREEMAAMGRAARVEYEAKYTAERNYSRLIEIYHSVIRDYNPLKGRHQKPTRDTRTWDLAGPPHPQTMKYTVFKAHDLYQQPGGEDESVRTEQDLLKRVGHSVIEYIRDNDEIAAYSLTEMASLGLRTVWAWDSYRHVRALLRGRKADVAHFDNTFPLISPAVYYACQEAGVPVVQTLRNYRLLCPCATFQREGRICEECLSHSLWRGVRRGCYRRSRTATAAVALMLSTHRWLGTWGKLVDCYIALSEFARAKFIDAGLPAEKIVVKPNFVYPDPMADPAALSVADDKSPQAGALFVGRLSPEKGVATLLAAWRQIDARFPLHVVGDGPLRAQLEAYARQHRLANIFFHGRLNHQQTFTYIKRNRFLVFPSEWYETFGRVAAEAFACGVPVIASRIGAIQEIVADGRTGLHFSPGDPDDLAAKIVWASAHPEEMTVMGRAARAEYEAKYTAERNYAMLTEIYRRAIDQHQPA